MEKRKAHKEEKKKEETIFSIDGNFPNFLFALYLFVFLVILFFLHFVPLW